MASRVVAALEEFQTRLSNELTRTTAHLNAFRSVLEEVEAVVDKTNNNLAEKRWGCFKHGDRYCQEVAGRLSKLGLDLNACLGLCSNFQTDVPKLDINRIIGEISNISFIRKHEDEKFIRKKDLISNEIRLLMDTTDEQDIDSDTSLEGSCSIYSDDSEHESKASGHANDQESTKTKTGPSRSKNSDQDNKQSLLKSNRNNANITGPGARPERVKAKTDSGKPLLSQNAMVMPVKRNSQGTQSMAYKKTDLFQFKGTPSSVPFSNQPGLLGPRPTILPMQSASQNIPLRFSHFIQAGQQQSPSATANFGAVHNMNPLSGVGQARFGQLNFNFASTQPYSSHFDFGSPSIAQKSLLASMSARPSSLVGSNPARNSNSQVKQQNQGKVGDQLFGAKSDFFFPAQQGNPRSAAYMQSSQGGVLGSHSLMGKCHESLEQQLNEIAQKIQQMQLASNRNLHLQHLMLETERLKQLVSQKQHQKQDQFKHQFQLLINAFMQQQQQQLQAPQPKMARSVQFYNSQKQQQRLIHNRQQQLRKQKQQNKAQTVKQEVQQQPARENGLVKTTKQDSLSGQPHKIALQNGEDSKRKIISEDSLVTRIGTFSPHAHGDKHRAGVSSVVLIEDAGSVVVIDIINSCLKLYSVTVTSTAPMELTHHLVTRLELSRPYYMSRLNRDMIVVSREGKILSLVRVSKSRLEFLQDIRTESQYYGLGHVKDNLIVCAAFADGKIDLLSIKDGNTQTVTLLTQCKAPELVAAVPSTGCILYLERAVNETVHLLGISQQGGIDFSVDLKSSPTDVWSVASISDKILCCSKQNGRVKLFSETGKFLADIVFPVGALNQPFAMAFCDSGNMYIANDGAWDSEYEHYVTTDINVYSFS